MRKLFTLSAFLFIPIIALLFVQCSEQFVEPNAQDLASLNKKVPVGNNLSFPGLLADEYTLTPIDATLWGLPYTGPYLGLTTDELAALVGYDWYAQKVDGNIWQADYAYWTAGDYVSFIDWGDNIESFNPRIGTSFRLEVTLYKELTTKMTGYTMAVLSYPNSKDEVQGTNKEIYESSEATIASNTARIAIQPWNWNADETQQTTPTTWNATDGKWDNAGDPESVVFGVELNVDGKLIYATASEGWKPENEGNYRLTFYLEDSEVNLSTAIIGREPISQVAEATVDGANDLTYIDIVVDPRIMGGTKDYGDLIVCLRNEDGIPSYEYFPEEHDPYYPLPIKFTAEGIPYEIDGVYQTFVLAADGTSIPEEGYVVKEADFGRLSLVRSPQSVLDAALDEAISGLTQDGVTDITTDASGRLVAIIGAEDWLVNYDEIDGNEEYDDKTIDSPVENMAIYQELMNRGFGGKLIILNPYFTNDDILNLAFGALAAGGDKTGNIMVDEIAYLNDWILDWSTIKLLYGAGAVLGPDPKERSYFNYGEGGANFEYSRDIYKDKYVKITTLYADGTWTETIVSLLNVVPWTPAERLIDYSGNTNITGFANAVDDAIQVLEFIHSSDLIVYSPYFTP